MNITPEDFVKVLQKTSLKPDEKEAIVDLLKHLETEQIEEIYKILLEDAREMEKIIRRMKMGNQKELLKLKQDVKRQKEEQK